MKQNIIITLFLILFCIGLGFVTQNKINQTRPDLNLTGEMRYLPKGPALDMTSCGIKGVFADILWNKALCYVTRHFGIDRNFPYLARIFDVITDLDPQFVKAYHYGGFLLTSAALKTPEAIKILTKGVKNNPNVWRLQYDLAHVYSFFAKDKINSAKYFAMAAQTATNQGKDASILFEQATDYYVQDDGFEEARQMWRNFANSPDKKRKKIATEQIKRINAQEMIKHLQSAVDLYKNIFGHLPKTLKNLQGFKTPKGTINQIPKDPFGKAYTLINGKVSCQLFNNENYAKNIVYLKKIIALFKKKYGYFPMTLSELISRNITKDLPNSPTGIDYIYDPISGDVQ